jgi:hypothetical protein
MTAFCVDGRELNGEQQEESGVEMVFIEVGEMMKLGSGYAEWQGG